MGELRNFVTPLHQITKRDSLARMIDDKVHCMQVARKFDKIFWDGDRRYGYGGYTYMPGRWRPVAEALINTYNLGPGDKVLDVGCGKGFLLQEMLLIQPGLDIYGFDISEYALGCADEVLKSHLFKHCAQSAYPFADKEFELVISLGTLHNLRVFELEKALSEIERVGKQGYLMVESYRNEAELFNLQCWALTCESFFDKEEWVWLYDRFGYSGDYEFIYF